MRVLVIDDSPVAREVLRGHLLGHGIEVFELPSAIGATREITRNRIDVAVIDVGMPGLAGNKLVDLLRGHERLKGLAIVLISAAPAGELEEIGRTCACDAVVSKDDVELRLVSVLRRIHRAAKEAARGGTPRSGSAA